MKTKTTYSAQTYRKIAVLLVCGWVWYAWFYLLFIVSQAQTILANSAYQSSKFLKVFMEVEPFPKAAFDAYFLLKGFYIIGVISAGVFLYLNNKLGGNWLAKGTKFGLVQWALMIPWFEFYLPYNVMHEPLLLVLLEGALWLGTLTGIGITYSFIVNYQRNLHP